MKILTQNSLQLHTPEQIAEFKMQIAVVVKRYSRQQLLLAMGMLNSYAWRIAVDWDCLIEDNGRWMVDGERLRQLAYGCSQGKGTLRNAIKHIHEYIRRHWQFACRDIKTVRAMRSRFRDWGLFNFEDIETKAIVDANGDLCRIPAEPTIEITEVSQVNFLGLLLAYQVCDRVLKSRINEGEAKTRKKNKAELEQVGGDVTYHGWDRGLTKGDCMPAHGGLLMKEMFNECFSCLYQEDSENICFLMPRQEGKTPVGKPLAYTWKRSFGLKLKKWYDLRSKLVDRFWDILDREETPAEVPY